MDPLTGADYPDFEGVLARIRAVPGDKIHFFEISDVIQPTAAAPLLKGSEYDAYHAADPDARALFTWSICGRCLPLVGKNAGDDVRGPEDLGGARAAEIFKAVLDTGFRGTSSFPSGTPATSSRAPADTSSHPRPQARVRSRSSSSST